MFVKGQTVVQWIEQFAPKRLAVEDDRIGLQLGTLNKEIRKILVALDVVDEVVEEAIENQADLIIAHHAIIYRPLKHIQTDSPYGRLYEKLIKNDIAVYIAHTNLDAAPGGINDMMADALKLGSLTPLEEGYADGDKAFGLGRVGRLPETISLQALAERVKQAFDVPVVRVVGDLSRQVSKAAVLGGAGSRYVNRAVFVGADVFITGDIDYHTAHDAAAAGIALIDPGHNVEKIMKDCVADWLNDKLIKHHYSTRAIASQPNTEPFRFI